MLDMNKTKEGFRYKNVNTNDKIMNYTIKKINVLLLPFDRLRDQLSNERDPINDDE